MKCLKVCFIGGPASGKSSFKKLCLTNSLNENDCNLMKSVTPNLASQLDETYKPTLGVSVKTINYEDLKIKIWDTGGVEKYRGLGDGYYLNSDAAIAFYTKDTFKETSTLVRDFKRVCPKA